MSTVAAAKLLNSSIHYPRNLFEQKLIRGEWVFQGKREVLRLSSADIRAWIPKAKKNKRVGRELFCREVKRKPVLSRGYVQIFKPDHPRADCQGYVPEHRLKIEEKLGRFLVDMEEVHHINGIKDDNRIENLALFDQRSDHIKLAHGTAYSLLMQVRRLLVIDPKFEAKLRKLIKQNN